MFFTLSSRCGNKLVRSVSRHESFKSRRWRRFWYAWLIGVQDVPLVHLRQVVQLERSEILEYLKETKNIMTTWRLGSLSETFSANVGVMWNFVARERNRQVHRVSLKSKVLFSTKSDQPFPKFRCTQNCTKVQKASASRHLRWQKSYRAEASNIRSTLTSNCSSSVLSTMFAIFYQSFLQRNNPTS